MTRIVTPGAGERPGTDGTASEFPAKGAGNPWRKTGDRRDCQRISGKRRRKSMAVSSVPGRAMVQYRVKGSAMNRKVYAALLPVLGFTVWAIAQTPADPLIEGLRNVEVASVADAMEQLYGQKAYMSHDMRPLAKTKFAGPAVTVLMKKEEHAEGSKASQGMLDAIDAAAPGSVYVMVLENGLDYAGIGALMATAMKVRGLTAAVIDGSVRDTPQIGRLQFPVFSRGVAPSTTIKHFRFAGANIA